MISALKRPRSNTDSLAEAARRCLRGQAVSVVPSVMGRVGSDIVLPPVRHKSSTGAFPGIILPPRVRFSFHITIFTLFFLNVGGKYEIRELSLL